MPGTEYPVPSTQYCVLKSAGRHSRPYGSRRQNRLDSPAQLVRLDPADEQPRPASHPRSAQSAISAAKDPWLSTSTSALLAFPFSGGRVTQTLSIPSCSPSMPVAPGPGPGPNGEDRPLGVRFQGDHRSAPFEQRPSRSARSWPPLRSPPRSRRSSPSKARPARRPPDIAAGAGRDSARRAAKSLRDRSAPPSKPAMHISPRTSRCPSRASGSRHASMSSGSKLCLAASPETFTSSSTAPAVPDIARDPLNGLDQRQAVGRLEHVDHRQGTADLIPLERADHVPADRQIGQPGRPFPTAFAGGSRPTRGSPPRPGRIAASATNFVTATSLTCSGRRPLRAAASAICRRTRRDSR